jgi:hypothetical protein
MEWNPPPPPGHGGKRRHYAKDDLDHSGMDGHGISALGEMLRKMNPYALGNPQGVCETCAWETVRVLLTGGKPRPVIKITPPNEEERLDWHEREQERWKGLKAAETKGKLLKAPDAPRAQAFGEHRVRDAYEGFAKKQWKRQEKFEPAAHRAQAIFAWLSRAEHGEGVFVADGGGHVWNYLRVAGRIFLIDVSTSLFRELTRGGDGRAKYWERGGESIPFHYLDPVSLSRPDVHKAFTIYTCGGPIHPRWRRLLLPPGTSGGWSLESPF